MPDPLSIAALVTLKGAEKFAKQRDKARAQSRNEEMEAMKRVLEALGQRAMPGGAVSAQPGVVTQGLQAANDPLAQQMIAQLFKKILGGGGGT